MVTSQSHTLSLSNIDLTTCDKEPIHIPGRIQPHGVLLALQEADLTIKQISTNTFDYLGYSPEQLLGQPLNFLFDETVCDDLKQQLASQNVSYETPLQIVSQVGPQAHIFDGVAHRQDGLIILELENMRQHSTNANIAPSLNYFLLIRRAMSKINAGQNLQLTCDTLAEEVQKFTEFDRVMIYKFHPDRHGEVISEAMVEGQESYLGLHYPATDIPQQARRLYTLNWLRLIADVEYEAMPLIPENNPLTNQPLDLSYSVLRSVSPVHVQYLKNMGVAASMSISLLKGDELWGLIACHHRQPKFVPYNVRAACELLGTVMSFQLITKEESEGAVYYTQLQTFEAKLLQTIADTGLVTGLINNEKTLLDITAATGAVVSFGGEIRLLGQTPTVEQINNLLQWLQAHSTKEIFQTNALSQHYPPAKEYADVASGVLAIALSSQQSDYILFFRPEVTQVIKWAGNPNKAVEMVDSGEFVMHPRQSFAQWQETVTLQSLPWQATEIEIANKLRNSIIKFIIERATELEKLNKELESSNSELDSFAYIASHDLKEPLRGIYGYAHYLGENYVDVLDDTAKQKIDGLMRLTKRIHNLLDSLLHFSQVGRLEIDRDPVDLNELLDEALDMLSVRQEESGSQLRIPRPLPSARGEPVRLREVWLNLISNAFKYKDKAEPWVEIGYLTPEEQAEAGQPTTVTNVFYVRDNGIGIKERHYTRIFEIFKRLHGRDKFGGGTGAGLTIVKKIIDKHGGQIWLDSTPGVGTTFYFTLEPIENGS